MIGGKKSVQKFTDQATSQAESVEGRSDADVVLGNAISFHPADTRVQAQVLSLKMEVCLATERLHSAKVDQENAEVCAHVWPGQGRGSAVMLTLICGQFACVCVHIYVVCACANNWCACCQRAHLETLSQHQRSAAEEKLKLQRIIMVRGVG